MKTTTLSYSLGCVFVALLTLGCEDPSTSTDQAAQTNDPVEQTVEQQPDVTTPPVEDVTKPPIETPQAHATLSDPACATQCKGFWAKRTDVNEDGTHKYYYLDGIVEDDYRVTATCSINAKGQCCMRLKGKLGTTVQKDEVTVEDTDSTDGNGKLPVITDVMDGIELYDDGDPNIMLMNIWAYGEINGTYAYIRE